jgi:lipid-binding SYLF domain-containing protein
MIPPQVLQQAKGLAFLTVTKVRTCLARDCCGFGPGGRGEADPVCRLGCARSQAGFLFSIRAGSGLVIARLADGTWSAPSAIGTAGVGAGLMAGAEMAEFLIILK